MVKIQKRILSRLRNERKRKSFYNKENLMTQSIVTISKSILNLLNTKCFLLFRQFLFAPFLCYETETELSNVLQMFSYFVEMNRFKDANEDIDSSIEFGCPKNKFLI